MSGSLTPTSDTVRPGVSQTSELVRRLRLRNAVGFGLPWGEPAQVVQPAAGGGDVTGTVRQAAKELVESLKQAARLSGHWSDAKLADTLIDAAFSQCLAQLAATGCWGVANRLPSSELWRIAGPLLEVGYLQHRARLKPLGYAGDFEMLRRIWQRQCCDDPLGAAFDRYFLRQAAPAAVCSRIELAAAALVAHCLASHEGPYRVLSVGSGPAFDLSEALSMLPAERRGELRVTLLDLDPAALEFARRRLAPLLPPEALRCIRTNPKRLPQAADREAMLRTPDFLLCSGFFDYLADEPVTAMLRLFRRQLAPGGLMVAGNFSSHNPTRAYMEWIGNWYITYRTPDDFHRLALAAGLPPDEFTIGCERLGVELFLVGHKS